MPGGGDDITLGEVVRSLEALAKQVDRRFDAVESRMGSMEMVHPDVYVADRAADSLRHAAIGDRIAVVEKDVAAIRNSNQWLVRTIVGAIIVIVVGAVWSLSTIGGVR